MPHGRFQVSLLAWWLLFKELGNCHRCQGRIPRKTPGPCEPRSAMLTTALFQGGDLRCLELRQGLLERPKDTGYATHGHELAALADHVLHHERLTTA